MPKHDNLASLINTLTPAEQRYFKLFSGLQAGEKKYVKIFDAIEQQGVYDAAMVSKKTSIPAGQLAVHKHYLNSVLLNSLRSNTEQATPNDKIYLNTVDIRLLLKRRLFAQALELVEKTVAQAWDSELFELLHELLRMKQECLLEVQRHTDAIKLNEDRTKLMAISQQYNDIIQLRNFMIWEDKKRDNIAAVKKIMQHKLMKTAPEKLLSLRAGIAWYEITWYGYLLLNKHGKDLLLLARKDNAFFEKHPKLKRIHGMACVSSYAHLSKAEGHAGNIKTALNILSKLEQMIDAGEFTIAPIKAASVKSYIYGAKAIIYRSEGMFKEMLHEVEKAAPLKKSRSLYEQLSVDFSEAVALVHLQQTSKAVTKIDALIQLKLPARPIMEKSLRPLLIMAQIDMGNYQLLPYLIKAAKAWMKRQHIHNAECDAFYNYATELYTATSHNQRKQIYRRLLHDVTTDKIITLADNCSLSYWLQRKIKD